jgi:hypothetical protein
MNEVSSSGFLWIRSNSSINAALNSATSSGVKLDNRPCWVCSQTISSGLASGAYPGNLSVTISG